MLSSESLPLRLAQEVRKEQYGLLGTWVNALTASDLNALLRAVVESGARRIVAHHNLHSIYVYHHNAKMQDFYAKADYIHADGMAMVILGRLLGLPLKRDHRVTYADWIYSIMAEAAENNWRVFYLGSKPGVAKLGAEKLRKKHPLLDIQTADGYFDADKQSQENLGIVERINKYQPHILMVGMSMPRQENWILDNLDQLQVNVILPCGAAIDYVAGAVPTPPRWAGRWGLEWLFRLLSEPNRLWQRYLIEPWFVVKMLMVQFIKPVKQQEN